MSADARRLYARGRCGPDAHEFERVKTRSGKTTTASSHVPHVARSLPPSMRSPGRRLSRASFHPTRREPRNHPHEIGGCRRTLGGPMPADDVDLTLMNSRGSKLDRAKRPPHRPTSRTSRAACRRRCARPRWSGAYSVQVETLRRLRHGGDQYVRVEHVHVNEGGQAIVGNVKTAGSGAAGSPEQSASGVIAPANQDR